MMSGIQFGEVHKAVVSAFSTNELILLCRTKFDASLIAQINFAAPLSEVVYDLITKAEQGGWETELIEAVFLQRPKNPLVAAVYEKYGPAQGVLQVRGKTIASAPATFTEAGFERIVRSGYPFIDLGNLEGIIKQTCFINIGGRAMGTGFLVGPDVVLTNYHVMQRYISPNTGKVDSIRCTFDSKTLQDGTRGGYDVALASDWLIDSSPYSPAEARNQPDADLPKPDQLDYALMRLATPVGADASRGWVKVPQFAPPAPAPAGPPNPFKPPMLLMIVQHPDGRPLQLAVDPDAVLNLNDTGTGVNSNRTRVRYATNTEGGSSGSPVFDKDWNLVALHHYGDPSYNHPASYNQGIPIDAIRILLRERGNEQFFAQ